MPKMKTKSGAKKRFSVTATGKVKCKQAHARHLLSNKAKSAKLRNRGSTIMFDTDGKNVLRYWMPNSF